MLGLPECLSATETVFCVAVVHLSILTGKYLYRRFLRSDIRDIGDASSRKKDPTH